MGNEMWNYKIIGTEIRKKETLDLLHIASGDEKSG
jgi:hypothetical protein